MTAVVVLIAAGCGSSGKSTSPTTASGTAATTASTASVAASTTLSTLPQAAVAALNMKAISALFQPADFPAAFKQQPDGMAGCPDSSSSCASLSLEQVWNDLTSCLRVKDTPEAKATSPTYKEGVATQARVTVEYTSADAAAGIAAALAGPKLNDCMMTAFTADAKASAPPGATPGPTRVSALTAPALGASAGSAKTSATRINVDMNLGGGLVIHIFQDFVVVVNGTAVSRFFFLNPGGPFLPTLETPLVQKVVMKAGS